MDPAGKFLYAMNYYYGEIFVYSIDQNTSALTLGTNSPFQTQYYYPTVFTLDATGQFAYVLVLIRSEVGSASLRPGLPVDVRVDVQLQVRDDVRRQSRQRTGIDAPAVSGAERRQRQSVT
jgi:hypothetical protein